MTRTAAQRARRRRKRKAQRKRHQNHNNKSLIENIVWLTGKDFVEAYEELPDLPIGSSINVKKIGCFENKLYEDFTFVNPKKYPPGKNPEMDYMPNDKVSPCCIYTNDGTVYKVNHWYWLALSDATLIIAESQSMTGPILPISIHIDRISQEGTVKFPSWMNMILTTAVMAKQRIREIISVTPEQDRFRRTATSIYKQMHGVTLHCAICADTEEECHLEHYKGYILCTDCIEIQRNM